MPRRVSRTAVLVFLFFGFLRPAFGSFHFMNIVEVFPGTATDPNAQYVVLQMYAANQHLVSGHFIRVYDASGGTLGTFTFSGNVANGATQSKILIATTEAVALFGISSDLTMTAVIPLAGGAVCFDAPDCVSWGNFTGNASLLDSAGTPFFANDGLILGHAIRRDISGGTSPTTLDASDDTNNSAADFDCANTAMPTNNAGSSGSYTDPNLCPVCGNNVDEAGEQCDGTDDTACPGKCLSSCNCQGNGYPLPMPTMPAWALLAFGLGVLTSAGLLIRRGPRARPAA